ncbi:unnamed protein product [Closterium sp. Naga37s-1]|nr:unnamed protein product [Closterium sp. Naga37s-1]
MRSGDRMKGAQESAAQEVSGEQGAEVDEEDPGLQVEGADEGDGDEDQAAGIDAAEPAQADENAGASQAEESHGRNARRGNEQRAEGSLRQERVAQDESGRDERTQRQRRRTGEESREVGAAAACVPRSGSRRAGADGRMSHALPSRMGVKERGKRRSSGPRGGAVGSNGSAAAWCAHQIGQGRERGGTAAGPARQTNAASGGRRRKEKGIRLSAASTAAEGDAPGHLCQRDGGTARRATGKGGGCTTRQCGSGLGQRSGEGRGKGTARRNGVGRRAGA